MSVFFSRFCFFQGQKEWQTLRYLGLFYKCSVLVLIHATAVKTPKHSTVDAYGKRLTDVTECMSVIQNSSQLSLRVCLVQISWTVIRSCVLVCNLEKVTHHQFHNICSVTHFVQNWLVSMKWRLVIGSRNIKTTIW